MTAFIARRRQPVMRHASRWRARRPREKPALANESTVPEDDVPVHGATLAPLTLGLAVVWASEDDCLGELLHPDPGKTMVFGHGPSRTDDTHVRRADLRVVAATNRPLDALRRTRRMPVFVQGVPVPPLLCVAQ